MECTEETSESSAECALTATERNWGFRGVVDIMDWFVGAWSIDAYIVGLPKLKSFPFTKVLNC